MKSKVNGTLTLRPVGFNGKDVKALVKVVDDEIAETDYVKAEQGRYKWVIVIFNEYNGQLFDMTDNL